MPRLRASRYRVCRALNIPARLAGDSIAFSHVDEATYVLRQRFRYDYPGPIADLHHRLMVVPREHDESQRRIPARLVVSPASETRDSFDAFGNPVTDSTTVETSAAEAFAVRAGVCQDYAHIMLALARHCGLAVRYVSGHLVGDGGMHAWVEIIVPENGDALVVAFDPTHGRRVDMRYVVVAIGRDYNDVAPTSGVFTAPYVGAMISSNTSAPRASDT